AQIPFHIYLTFTPGLFVPKAFEQEGFSYQFDFANKSAHQPSKIKPPTGQQPLIYNLFGSITEEESLILTHNDLYAYFKSVFERRSMPTILREALEKVNCFIFLGLPFEKWYMQMLLRELGIHKSSEDFIRFAAKQSLSDEIMTFCYDQFTINFVDHHVEEFIDLLYDHSSQAGILRNTSGTNPAEQLKVWIGEGKTEKILENLQQYLPKSHEWEGELLGLSSRHKRLNRRNRNGVITAEEFDVGLAQINQDILEIINEAL
ncbi:MAG: SIR2 family protein, partial [Bacteroidota bacterium]